MDGGEGPDGCVGGESGTDTCGADDDLKAWSLKHFFFIFAFLLLETGHFLDKWPQTKCNCQKRSKPEKNLTSDLTCHLKVGASIDESSQDNIPLRIILLFMDEVFDMKDRNQWLRKQLILVLKQLIKAMLGTIWIC